jgi:hypothetical protein
MQMVRPCNDSVLGHFVMGRLVIWPFGDGMFCDGPYRALGCLVMGPLVMGRCVMDHFVMVRFVMGRLVCESFKLGVIIVTTIGCK